MALFTQAGLKALNDAALAGVPVTWEVHLYKNNYTPVETSVAGDFTEADFGGYLPVAQTWGAATWDGTSGALSISATTDPVFTNDGSGSDNDIYGAYLVDGAGVVMAAGRDPAAPVTVANGDTYTVAPAAWADNP